MRPTAWTKLLEVAKEHSSLNSLNLSHNRLMEKQNERLTQKEIDSGVEYAALSKSNQNFADNLCELLEFNRNMIHLNLDFTGITENVMKMLIRNLHHTLGMRCLHLCGNIKISEKLREWLKLEVNGKLQPEP